MSKPSKDYLNPYLAGFMLGCVLFTSYLVFGHGLGASGGVAVLSAKALDTVAPNHVSASSYYIDLVRKHAHALDTWLVWEIVGVLIGGFVSGLMAGRIKAETFHGPSISSRQRLFFAVLGGAIAGFGVRMSRGCTSSQALSGGAVLSAGSWAFMFAVFGGAYLMAYPVRKLWR
ncbi:MAG: hypothetical protein CSA62_15320 [Planctomycetota bacterium]|nr:MAG: hypothetical protein CSA62_15320 [Planctomycetota bacterium]